MPTTKEVINHIKMAAPGWNREGEKGILSLLNEAQNILMQQPVEQMIKYDDATGDLPYLATTEDVYEYDMTSDMWRVDMVLLDVLTSSNLYSVFAADYGLRPTVYPPIQKYRFRGREYYRLEQITSVDRNYSDVCKILFNINPTTTTDEYRVLGYKRPTQIITESTQLTVPERLHYTILIPATIKLIEGIQNSVWEKSLEYIEKVLKKRMRMELDGGEQGESYTIRRRKI